MVPMPTLPNKFILQRYVGIWPHLLQKMNCIDKCLLEFPVGGITRADFNLGYIYSEIPEYYNLDKVHSSHASLKRCINLVFRPSFSCTKQ